MALTCRDGAYNRIFKELLDLKIPIGDIFLLFGPIDMMIQFTGFENVDEFKEKWFNPIRMIGAEEGLIAKTLTFIGISESPSFAEKPFAFIFLNTQPRSLEEVRKELLSLPEVLSADTVFGPYDIICAVKVKDNADLRRLVSNIRQNIFGIEGSVTATITLLRV